MWMKASERTIDKWTTASKSTEHLPELEVRLSITVATTVATVRRATPSADKGRRQKKRSFGE